MGLLGGAIDRLVGPANNNTEAGVFVVWETGVALLLGLFLERVRESASTRFEQPQSREGERQGHTIGVSAGAFLAVVLAAFGFLVYRSVDTYFFAKQAVVKELIAEVPSPAVGPLAPLAAEQIFVMHDISGLRPLGPMDNGSTTWKVSAPMPHVLSIGYGLDVANSIPSLQRKAYVEVMRLPNEEWARYQAKYAVTQVRIYCATCASNVTSVAKFGNRVTQISQQLPGNVSFLWSSDNLVVTVTKENAMSVGGAVPQVIAAAEEDILRLYLEKYPSK
jgi:hypothetical protein